MTTMRALVVTEHGDAGVLAVQDKPVPEPGPGEVVIEVAASGVNFKDVYMREGIYPRATPFTLGDEAAGTVVAVGDGVQWPAVGDHVAGVSMAGAHAGYALSPAAALVAVPAGVDDVTAAAVLLQGLTAHYLVRTTFPVSAGDTVLVHAGAGGVGRLLIQLATSAGATVVATVGSAAKVAIAEACGAAHVIRYDEVDDLAAAVRAIVPGGVRAVYDGVGKDTFDASLASLAPLGGLALFGASSGQVPPFEIQRLNSGGSLFLTRPTLVDYVATPEALTARADDVFAAVADGTLDVAIGGTYALEDAASAYRDLEGRATTGKLVLTP